MLIENRFISVAHRTVCCLRATASIFCPHNQMPYTQTHLNSHLFTSSPTLSKHTSYRLKRIYGYIMLRFFFCESSRDNEIKSLTNWTVNIGFLSCISSSFSSSLSSLSSSRKISLLQISPFRRSEHTHNWCFCVKYKSNGVLWLLHDDGVKCAKKEVKFYFWQRIFHPRFLLHIQKETFTLNHSNQKTPKAAKKYNQNGTHQQKVLATKFHVHS